MSTKTPFLLSLLFILSIFFAETAAAKSTEDSLLTMLAEHPQQDDDRFWLLGQLFLNYKENKTDTLLPLAEEAIAIANKLDKPVYHAQAIEMKGIAYSFNNLHDSGFHYIRESIAISKKHHIDTTLTSAYNSMGLTYFFTSDYKNALKYYELAYKLAKQHGQLLLSASAANNIASVFFKKGMYTRSLEYYLSSLKIYLELGAKREIASGYYNIGTVHFRMEEYDKALEYTRRSMEVMGDDQAPLHDLSYHNNFAMIYDALEQYDSSLYHLQEALDIAENINNVYLVNLLKGNIAELYYNTKEYNKAFDLYRETLTVSEKIEDIEGAALAEAGLGKLYLQKGDFGTGTSYLKKALTFMQQADIKEQIKDISSVLAEVYEERGNDGEALKFYKIMDAAQDSMDVEKNKANIHQAEFEFELQQKEDRIELLEKDKKLAISKNAVQTAISIALVLVLILSGAVIYLNRRNLKQSRERNRIVTEQKAIAEQHARKLAELNEYKDTTFSVLSHDLRSPVNALTATIDMLDKGLITPEEFAAFKEELNTKLQSVTLLLDNLLFWARSQMKGEQTFNPEKLSLRRKILYTIAVAKDAVVQKLITIEEDSPEDLYIMADRTQLEMILRNIMSNAVKFTPQGGKITITGRKNEDYGEVIIEDTGMGMTREQISNLFDGNPNQSTTGTGGEKGTGIGMHLSYSFIKRNNGNILVESTLGKGTKFTVQLPLA